MTNTPALPADVTLIGAPTDIGAGARGASMGPEALRVANLGPVIEALGYQVRDSDLVAIGTGREVGPPGNRREASEEYRPEKNLDLAEFFLSLGSRTEFWEMHHSAGNHLNNHWCRVPPPEVWKQNGKPKYADVTFDRERYVPDDGSRTVARGAMEDAASGTKAAIEAIGSTPLELALGLAKSLLSAPWMKTISKTRLRGLLKK